MNTQTDVNHNKTQISQHIFSTPYYRNPLKNILLNLKVIMHGKKETGDRKKRMGKRERLHRDSRQKIIQPVYLKALATRIASRCIFKVLSKDNITQTEQHVTNQLQAQLETEINEAIVLSTEQIDNNPDLLESAEENEKLEETELPIQEPPSPQTDNL